MGGREGKERVRNKIVKKIKIKIVRKEIVKE